MHVVNVSNLKRHFRVHQRKPGFLPSLKSLVSRKEKIVKAVDGVSFKIAQGELVGFIGPNGAGKTTTLKCLSGLLYPTEGNIKVLGFNPFDRKSEFLKQISLVMGQKNQLWWNLNALETFRLNKEIYDIKEKDYNKSLNELSCLLEVQDLLTIPVRQLSLGERMKMELIAVLLHKPKILFLDEPTIGLDVVMQKKIRDFIAEYNNRFSSTILLTSHYMQDVKKLCERVIVINKGKIIYDGLLHKLVEKHVNFKIITAVFNKKVQQKDLLKMGKILTYDKHKITFSIPKKTSKKVATTLLSKFPVEDLNIEEPEIEEVIRLMFDKKNK